MSKKAKGIDNESAPLHSLSIVPLLPLISEIPSLLMHDASYLQKESSKTGGGNKAGHSGLIGSSTSGGG